MKLYNIDFVTTELHLHPPEDRERSYSIFILFLGILLLTDKAKGAARLFDMIIFDHLIIGEAGYYSFADDGML